MITNDNKKNAPKKFEKFVCEKCDFKCSRLSNYIKHLETKKHNDNKKMPKNAAPKFICKNCNNQYTFASGLSRHRKKCGVVVLIPDNYINTNMVYNYYTENNTEIINIINEDYINGEKIKDNNDNNREKIKNMSSNNGEKIKNMSSNNGEKMNDMSCDNGEKMNDISCDIVDKIENISGVSINNISKEMIIDLIKENLEIKKLLREQSDAINNQNKQIENIIPKINIINENVINNTSIKNNFNINIFLNEKCKGALNMDEFIQNIDITLNQLEFITNKGLEEGLSNVFLENISKLSLYERPIHCTDIKRETLYIKNHDMWERDSDKTKIKRAIKVTSGKQYKTLKEWKDKNPDFQEINEKQDYFAKTISTIGKPMTLIDNKIIKQLCNKTYIKND